MSSVFQSEDTEQDAALGALQSFHRVESVQRLPMGGGKPFPELFKDRKAYVVEFDGTTDEWHPQNWPSSRRLFIAIIVCYGTFVATFNSALFAPGAAQASQHFSVGDEVGQLGTSLFVLGFALGPVIWAPLSELIGRWWPLIVGMLGTSIFTIGSATSKDIQTLIICRFFAGVFGSSPLCVVPGILSDLYNDIHRATAISVYALAVFVGPLAGPFIGAFVSKSYLGWRWTLYIPAIMGFFDVALLALVKETYPAVVLIKKAAQIRHETGNWSVHAEQETVEFDMHSLIQKYFTRPLKMLATEPIVGLVSLYMSFIYGLVYCLLGAYPYVFEHTYGLVPGVSALPFIALIIGVTIAVCFIIVQQAQYRKKVVASGGTVSPEARLFPAVVGAFAFTVGLFWFAWTAFSLDIHWMAPTASGVVTGFGLLTIFLSCFNYLVDAYLPLAASVVAANVMLRSGVAAAFPLFSVQMFENLGVQWAGTLLACLAALMIPIPLAFRAYGSRLRKGSRMLSQFRSHSSNSEKV